MFVPNWTSEWGSENPNSPRFMGPHSCLAPGTDNPYYAPALKTHTDNPHYAPALTTHTTPLHRRYDMCMSNKSYAHIRHLKLEHAINDLLRHKYRYLQLVFERIINK